MANATECFSDTCGLCKNCTDNYINSLNKSDIKNELNQRGLELYKMMGKNYVEEVNNRYNKDLKEWCKKYEYKDPYCYGYAPNIIKTDKTGKVLKFEFIDKKHQYICDNTYCRMMYESKTDWEKQKYYPNIPIYKRIKEEGDKGGCNQLCCLCINRNF